MYKRVSGVKFWLLGLVTFGIYPLVVWARMGDNLNAMALKAGENTISSYWLAFLLGGVTFGIFPLIWMFKFYSLATALNAKANAGVTPENVFVKFLIGFVPIYSFFWLADLNNTLADAYERM